VGPRTGVNMETKWKIFVLVWNETRSFSSKLVKLMTELSRPSVSNFEKVHGD
jgi:hypothetical protein